MRETLETKPAKLTHNELSDIETAISWMVRYWKEKQEAITNEDDNVLYEIADEWNEDIIDDDGEYSFEKADAAVCQHLEDHQALLTRVQELQTYCEDCGQKASLSYSDDNLLLCEACVEKHEQVKS